MPAIITAWDTNISHLYLPVSAMVLNVFAWLIVPRCVETVMQLTKPVRGSGPWAPHCDLCRRSVQEHTSAAGADDARATRQ
jgi:hypothetical protein